MIDPAHLRIEIMTSGRLTLVLRENASWADFEIFAPQFLAAHGGTVIDRADSPVERVRTVKFGSAEVWLAFDDAMARFEINSKDAAGDACVRRLAQKLGTGR
jgi:hypothetical protein